MRFLYCLFILCSFNSLFAQDECAFDFHEFDANFKEQALANFVTKGVTPPFKHLEIPFEDFTFKPDRPNIFTLPSGTMIDVPKNAFRDKNGKIVEEKVVLYYREFNNPTDILLSGIPMNYKTPEGDMPMQSAGMFEIRASTTEGEELFVNENEPISVSVISTEAEDDFNYYEMGDETGEWVEKGKDELDYIGDWNLFASNVDKPELKLPPLNIDVLSRKVLRRNRKLKFKATIRLSKKKNYDKIIGMNSLGFSEMSAWKNLIWIYDGDKKNEVRRKLIEIDDNQKRYSYKRVGRYMQAEKLSDSLHLTDIKLIVNPEGDNYLFSFFWADESFTIPVYPYFKTKSEKIEQKRNLKAFNEYLVLLEERRIRWKRKKAFYESESILYERAQEIWKEQTELAEKNGKTLNPLDFELALGKELPTLARRRTWIQNFGVCNIDRIIKGLSREEILVEAEDKTGQPLKIETCYIWDDANGILLPYFSNRIQLMRNSKENTLTLLFADNQTAVVSTTEFNEAMKVKKGKKLKFTVEPKADKTINRQQISEITAAL